MRPHLERHRTERIGWLRAAVLGANDGIVSTASLVVGVAAADWLPWQRHLRSQGIDARPEDHGEAWSMYFADPDGNPYELTCYDVAVLRSGGGASHEAINH